MRETRVDIFMPLYVRDFIAATLGWTAAEKGHYMTLLMVQWDRGLLPADVAALDRLSPGIGEAWSLLEPKFPLGADGHRRNHRLEEHRAKAVEMRQKRAEAGAKGGRSRAQAPLKPGSSTAQAKSNHPEPEPEPQSSSQGEEDRRPPGPVAAPAAAAARSVPGKAWRELLAAWRSGPGAPWPSQRPPAEAVRRLAEPGWLEMAREAIDRLPRCKFFREPVDLTQFCGEGFVDRVLGGRYDARYRKPGEPDVPVRVPRHDFGGDAMTDDEYARARRRASQQAQYRADRERARREREQELSLGEAVAAAQEGGR